MNFRVDLNIYRGPLDLLLYLVRKHELEITEIPVGLITEQFLQHLEILQELDVDGVGEFVEVASLLIEMKSRSVLPRVEEEESEIEDPREGLVERLLEYKRIKDAASMLEERSRQWQLQIPRLNNDLPPRRTAESEQPIQEVELWDLVSAMGRMMRERIVVQPSSIVYDDTPIHTYMDRIHQRLRTEGRVAFGHMFTAKMHKSAMIGVFLALLELARHHCVRAEQEDLHGEIWLYPGRDFSESLNLQSETSVTDKS